MHFEHVTVVVSKPFLLSFLEPEIWKLTGGSRGRDRGSISALLYCSSVARGNIVRLQSSSMYCTSCWVDEKVKQGETCPFRTCNCSMY